MNTTQQKFTTRRAKRFSKLIQGVGTFLLKSYLSQYSREELESAKMSIMNITRVLDALIPAAVSVDSEPKVANLLDKEVAR